MGAVDRELQGHLLLLSLAAQDLLLNRTLGFLRRLKIREHISLMTVKRLFPHVQGAHETWTRMLIRHDRARLEAEQNRDRRVERAPFGRDIMSKRFCPRSQAIVVISERNLLTGAMVTDVRKTNGRGNSGNGGNERIGGRRRGGTVAPSSESRVKTRKRISARGLIRFI